MKWAKDLWDRIAYRARIGFIFWNSSNQGTYNAGNNASKRRARALWHLERARQVLRCAVDGVHAPKQKRFA